MTNALKITGAVLTAVICVLAFTDHRPKRPTSPKPKTSVNEATFKSAHNFTADTLVPGFLNARIIVAN